MIYLPFQLDLIAYYPPTQSLVAYNTLPLVFFPSPDLPQLYPQGYHIQVEKRVEHIIGLFVSCTHELSNILTISIVNKLLIFLLYTLYIVYVGFSMDCNPI